MLCLSSATDDLGTELAERIVGEVMNHPINVLAPAEEDLNDHGRLSAECPLVAGDTLSRPAWESPLSVALRTLAHMD